MNAQILQLKTTADTDRRIGPNMAEHANQAHDIMESAGYIIAAIYDPDHGFNLDSVSRDVRDSITCLRDELEAAGYLDAYKNGDQLGLWNGLGLGDDHQAPTGHQSALDPVRREERERCKDKVWAFFGKWRTSGNKDLRQARDELIKAIDERD